MSLEEELEGFADLVMDVMSLYYRCRGYDANPTEVAQLDEALSKLMEEARRLGGLGQAIRLAYERGFLQHYRNPMKLIEMIERLQRSVRERIALFEKIGLKPDSPKSDQIWGIATSPLLYDPDLWKGKMTPERLKELIEAKEWVFEGDEDPEVLWRAIQAVKSKIIKKRMEQVLKDLKSWIDSFFQCFVEQERDMALDRYEEYRWLAEELGEPVRSLEAIIAERWGGGCAKLFLEWDDPEVEKDRRILDEFMMALDSAKNRLDMAERAEKSGERREAISNLMQARYFADKLAKILPQAEKLAEKYSGYKRFIREAREVLQRLEGVKVSEEDYDWVRLEVEGEQASLDSYLSA